MTRPILANFENVGYLPKADLPTSLLEKVLYQNEELVFAQKKPKDLVYYFPFVVVFVVVLEFVGFLIYNTIVEPSMWAFWILLYVPLIFFVLFVFLYSFGQGYTVLTNFRVMSLKPARFRKSITVTSIPLIAITEIKRPKPTTLEFWCGDKVGKHSPKIEMKELSESDASTIRDLIWVGKGRRINGSNMPLTMYGNPNLAQLKDDYKTLADKYTPLLWGYKSPSWQFFKRSLIVVFAFVAWCCIICIPLLILDAHLWVVLFGLMGGGFIVLIIVALPLAGITRGFDNFHSISEKHGIVLIRNGFSVLDIVIPYSQAYPLTSYIDLKDGSGTLTFYKSRFSFMSGPEAVVREEIIFNLFLQEKNHETV